MRVLGTLIGAYAATVPALHRMSDVEPRRGVGNCRVTRPRA
jgi:hypothetical protein